MRPAQSVRVLALLTAVGLEASAQTSSVRGPAMEVGPEIAAILYDHMASDLRKLVVAQELYFSDNNAYGKVLSATSKRQVYIRPSPGVTLTLTYVTANTWAGRATHEWMPGRSCVIAVGEVAPSRIPRTTQQGLVPQEEGRPVCDGG